MSLHVWPLSYALLALYPQEGRIYSSTIRIHFHSCLKHLLEILRLGTYRLLLSDLIYSLLCSHYSNPMFFPKDRYSPGFHHLPLVATPTLSVTVSPTLP